MTTNEELQKTIDELTSLNIKIVESIGTKELYESGLSSYLFIVANLMKRNDELSISNKRLSEINIRLSNENTQMTKDQKQLGLRYNELKRELEDKQGISISKYKELQNYYNFICEYFNVDHVEIKRAYEKRNNQDENWSEF